MRNDNNEDSLSSVVEGCSSKAPFRSIGLVQPQNAPTRTNETVSVDFTIISQPSGKQQKFGLWFDKR
jgi:hypothetical protein